MAASDVAFINANNASRRGRLNEDAAVKQEERQGVLEERQDVLFNRSTTLFEQQQKLLGDERELKKYGRDANSAMALFRATKGQVYQPILDLYERIPDGGKFHQFSRNEDGTFKFDIEWQGQRMRSDSASFDEVGKMAMSIANPAQYLQASGAAASAEADHQNKLEIERIKAQAKQKDKVSRIPGGALSVPEYNDLRKQFGEEYQDIRDNNPELLEMPDASTESGTRTLTFEEYQAKQFNRLGVDLSGLKVTDTGGVEDLTPPDPTTSTFTEVREFLVKSGRSDQTNATDATIDAFIQMGRAEELRDKFSGGTLTPAQDQKIESAITSKNAGTGDEAAAADAETASVIVRDGATGGDKGAKPENPFDAFAAEDKTPGRNAAQILQDVSNSLAGKQDKGRRKSQKQLWSGVASGKPGNDNPLAKDMLRLGQTPEGRAKVTELYKEARLDLPAALRKQLDAMFGIPSGTRTAKGEIQRGTA
jgi:hypothetical protein